MAKRSAEREYPEHLSRRADISGDGPLYTVKNMRATRWPDGPDSEILEWRTETFDVREITNVYFIVQWWTSFKWLAHTMLSFEFSDGRVVTPSAEIRPAIGQVFGLIGGLRKTYHLYYLWSTESDALLSRMYETHKAGVRINMIEAVLTHQASVRLFEACVARTQELHTTDEWYHGVNNSCTSTIFDVVEQAIPGSFKRSVKFKLPGYLPRFLAKSGALRLQGDFDETMRATLISDRILEIGEDPDFSRKLRSR